MAKQSTATATPVLLTRPEAQSRAFAAALGERFRDRLRPIIAPVMAPGFLSPQLPSGQFEAVIFTSATAVDAAVKLGAVLPGRAFCVGARTAAAAEAAGFKASSANGDADDLVAAILTWSPTGPLLHLRGAESRGQVAERLTSGGIETFSAVVYRQDPQPLTPEAIALLETPTPVILPLFSPRTAALLAAALPVTSRALLQLVAISAAVADAAGPIPRSTLLIARQPDADSMLDAVGTLLATNPPP